MIRQTWIEMGMPVTVCIADERGVAADVEAVAVWFDHVNRRFSPYLESSEVCLYNRGECALSASSDEFRMILELCRETSAETDGYFNAMFGDRYDPSGLVKGWAIQQASRILLDRGLTNHVVDAGGDVQAVGRNAEGQCWRVGIRNPFDREQVVKIVAVSNHGIATSGTAVRGEHIYDPVKATPVAGGPVSLTVIAPTVFEADRMATAAFAMGHYGLAFIARRQWLHGYAVWSDGTATSTQGFAAHVV